MLVCLGCAKKNFLLIYTIKLLKKTISKLNVLPRQNGIIHIIILL